MKKAKKQKALTKKDKALIKNMILKSAKQKAQHTDLAKVMMECCTAFERFNQVNKPLQGGGVTLGGRFNSAMYE